MTAWQKIVADLESLTESEVERLARLLEERRHGMTRADAEALDEADFWLTAELLALQREAVRLTASIDATAAYVAESCAAISKPSSWPDHLRRC